MTQQQLATFVPMILFFVVLYFVMLRPQMRQMRQRRELLSQLRKGDRIVTVGGLHATIIEIKDEVLTLELAPNLRVKAERGAVQGVRGRE